MKIKGVGGKFINIETDEVIDTIKQWDVFEGGTFDNPMAFSRIGWVKGDNNKAVSEAI